MEPIIVLVGFLGAGKTTLLKNMVEQLVEKNWRPAVILNDYENASIDAQQFMSLLGDNAVQALSGSCICCSGVTELRHQVNSILPRQNGITLIEANGTTDAVTLMEFLGVGIADGFLPPIQVSVVDCRHWQNRREFNDLEANQVQVASAVYLNHIEKSDPAKIKKIKEEILSINPCARFYQEGSFDPLSLTEVPSQASRHSGFDHSKSHWASASVPLPDPISSIQLMHILDDLPSSLLRVKGCTKLDNDQHYSFFERTPAYLDTTVKPYRGKLVSGPTLLVVGPGSHPNVLERIVQQHTGADS